MKGETKLWHSSEVGDGEFRRSEEQYGVGMDAAAAAESIDDEDEDEDADVDVEANADDEGHLSRKRGTQNGDSRLQKTYSNHPVVDG